MMTKELQLVRKNRMGNSIEFRRAEAWYVFVGNFGTPYSILVSASTHGEFFPIVDVLRALRVDLRALSQIFVEDPRTYYAQKISKRSALPAVRTYEELGRIDVWGTQGLSALAQLLQKTLNVLHDRMQEDRLCCRQYQPDGRSYKDITLPRM